MHFTKKAVASCSTCLTAPASDFTSAMPVRSYLLTSQKLAQREKSLQVEEMKKKLLLEVTQKPTCTK